MTEARTTLAIVAVLFVASVARADDTFELRAQPAKRMRVDELAWILTAGCEAGSEVQQRQCRLVRDRAWKPLAGATVAIEAERSAFVVGAWDAQKKSLPLTLTACIRCDTAVELDGKQRRVVAAGPRTQFDNARAFPDEASAKALTGQLANARVELIVKLPKVARKKPAPELALEVIAWRVIAPCDGSAVIANPPSSGVPPDPRACPK
ncbi:MAG TPA: hypothetical protein VIU61_26520 [Kofleriaceae bacterium]